MTTAKKSRLLCNQPTKRCAVIGAKGQLGTAILQLAAAETPTSAATATSSSAPAMTFEGFSHTQLDATDPTAVAATLGQGKYDVIINCAAYTAVDAAEDDPAASINTTIPAVLAKTLGQQCYIIHVSTDYVFGAPHPSTPPQPWKTTDQPAPNSAYGRTKLAGEAPILNINGTVVRTSWLYSGDTLEHHPDFVSTMLRLARSGTNPGVVDDQFGSPTYVFHLAAALIWLAQHPHPGLLHYSNTGTTSWYEFARTVFELAGHDPERVHPIPSSDYPQRATRPSYSVLDTSTWPGPKIAHWRASLPQAIRGDV